MLIRTRINPDYGCNGTFFESDEGADTMNALGQGYAIDMYSNDQPTTTLWYHDHSLGMTRLNVYAAGAGFWLIRDKNDGETGLKKGRLAWSGANAWATIRTASIRNGFGRGNAIREIPIAIQPKSFNVDGSSSTRLTVPSSRAWVTAKLLSTTLT